MEDVVGMFFMFLLYMINEQMMNDTCITHMYDKHVYEYFRRIVC